MSATDIKVANGPNVASTSKANLFAALDNVNDNTLPRTFNVVSTSIGDRQYRLPVPASAQKPPGTVTQAYKDRFLEILNNLLKKGVYIHQRGVGFTDSGSTRPYLTTAAIGPCTVIIGHRMNPPQGQPKGAFIAHVDKDQTTASLVEILNVFMESVPANEMVDIHFYGGRDRGISIATVRGLFDALYAFPKSGQFVLRSFNALSPTNNNSDLAFDTSDGTLIGVSKVALDGSLPSSNFFLDSTFRMFGNEYLLEDSSGMAVKAEASDNVALKTAAKNIRIQHDARSTYFTQARISYGAFFRNEMSDFIVRLIIQEAEKNVTESSRKRRKEDLITDLVELAVPERMELSLKQYFFYKRTTIPWGNRYDPDSLIVSATEKCYKKSTKDEVNKILYSWSAEFSRQYDTFLVDTGLVIKKP